MAAAVKTKPRQRTTAQIRKDILGVTKRLEAEIERIKKIEDGFSAKKNHLEKLTREYNTARLDSLIRRMTAKNLAYCPHCCKLVPESSIRYEEKSGTHIVTRNQYYDYEEAYHYEHYVCKCGRSLGFEKGGARATWIKLFKERFARSKKSELPQELLLVVPDNTLPPEPITIEGWYKWGSPHSQRFEGVQYFYVFGPGIDSSGWTIKKSRY